MHRFLAVVRWLLWYTPTGARILAGWFAAPGVDLCTEVDLISFGYSTVGEGKITSVDYDQLPVGRGFQDTSTYSS